VRGMYEPMRAMQTRHEPVYLVRACFVIIATRMCYTFSQCSLRCNIGVRQATRIQNEQFDELPTI
jgi:hypothetical protein